MHLWVARLNASRILRTPKILRRAVTIKAKTSWPEPALFSRTTSNESPRCELEALRTIKKPHLKVFMVGCTGENPLSLLAEDERIMHLDTVDNDPHQVHLGHFRKQASLHLSIQEQLRLYGLDITVPHYTSKAACVERITLYNKIGPHLPPETKQFFDDNLSEIELGLAHAGGMERMSHMMQEVLLKDLGISEPKQLIEEPGLLWSALIDCFNGENYSQIIRSTKTEKDWDEIIDTHRSTILSKVLNAIEDGLNHNYIAHFLFFNCYRKHGVPPYLNEDLQEKLKKRIQYLHVHSGDACTKLREFSLKGKYDLVSLSDSYDRMRIDEFENILRSKVIPSVQKGGGILLRTFLITTIEQVLDNAQLFVDRNFNDKLTKEVEKGYQFSQVVYARKILD